MIFLLLLYRHYVDFYTHVNTIYRQKTVETLPPTHTADMLPSGQKLFDRVAMTRPVPLLSPRTTSCNVRTQKPDPILVEKDQWAGPLNLVVWVAAGHVPLSHQEPG